MKKTLMILIMLLVMTTTAFAASLEQDKYEQAEKLGPSVVRYAYVLNRLAGSHAEFSVREQSDYLGIITELKAGDIIATGDDQLNFNLISELNLYSQTATARKLSLQPISFAELTPNEQLKYKGLKDFFIYAVQEQVVQQQQNNGLVIEGNTPIEEGQLYINTLYSLKSMYENYK